MAELDISLQRRARLDHILTVADRRLRVKQFPDALQRSLSAGVHINELRYSHNRPNGAGEIARKGKELSRGERSFVNEVAAIAEDNTYNRLYKKSYRNM